jgi:hypothetical protein
MGAELFHSDGRTDRQTDRQTDRGTVYRKDMTKVTFALHHFANSSKNNENIAHIFLHKKGVPECFHIPSMAHILKDIFYSFSKLLSLCYNFLLLLKHCDRFLSTFRRYVDFYF